MVKLSIILVHYNNTEDLKKYFGWLNDQDFRDFEVIVVDNKSEHHYIIDLSSFIKKFKKHSDFDIKIFYNNVNKGYAGGMNFGIKWSFGDLILISNTDIFFGSTFLDDAVKYMDNCDIMSPKIYYYPDMDRIWSSGGFFDFTDYRNLGVDNKEIDEITNVDYVSGCCIFIQREIFKKIKLFDENFFMYLEDSDFCYRAMGFRIVYYPKITVFHNITEKKEKQSEFVKINYFKSRLLFIFKHYPLKSLIYSLPTTIFIILISFLKSKIKNKFIKSLKVIINGTVLGLKVRFLLK